MKLASHYNKASIIVSVSILLVSGIIYFFTINHIARQQLDNDLSEEIEEVLEYINVNHHLPKAVDFDEDVTTFTKTNLKNFDTRFFDTPYINPKEKRTEAGRAVAALVKVNGENYLVTIIESRENIEYLIQIISAITLLLTAILLAILIVTNKFVLKGLWRPFYNILSELKLFSLADAQKSGNVNTRVDEFKELSDAVSKMASRVKSDYQGLKTFTENASHEIMTPLAVITSKLDTLIQDETLRADQFSQITDIYTAAGKLSRLNQSLLLLVKIDNDLLPDRELINLQLIIIEKVQQFQELLQNKKIELKIELDNLKINASRYLIDTLVNNLFSNAIRHNCTGGQIFIIIHKKQLLFQNTGEQLSLDETLIFDRFYKGKTSDGTGLGLAIMKTICQQYHFNISYAFTNDMHEFKLEF